MFRTRTGVAREPCWPARLFFFVRRLGGGEESILAPAEAVADRDTGGSGVRETLGAGEREGRDWRLREAWQRAGPEDRWMGEFAGVAWVVIRLWREQ